MSNTDSTSEDATSIGEIAETEALAANLDSAIYTADPSITLDEFIAQRSLVGFLRQQAEGARNRTTSPADEGDNTSTLESKLQLMGGA
jgi:hypothetical protein